MQVSAPHDQDAAAYDYDIAVSFAGEDREYVERFVRRLKDFNVRVFYDQDELAAMWGENLVDYLQAVYTRRARYAVLFVSQNYVRKKWTRYERQTVQGRALEQATSPYVLPIRLDDTELPGLHSTVGYLDARHMDLDAIVDIVQQKLGQTRVPVPPAPHDGKVPRTPEGIARLLEERPPGWEFLLYAAVMRRGTASLDEKFRDHVIRYARTSGFNLTDRAAFDMIRGTITQLLAIISSFNRMLAPDVQEAAFGRLGEPGDPDRIVHAANRLVSVQEELLDLAASLRATGITNRHLRQAADLIANSLDQPIEELRSFAQRYAEGAEQLIARHRSGQEATQSSIVVTLIAPPELAEQVEALLNEYAAEYAQSLEE